MSDTSSLEPYLGTRPVEPYREIIYENDLRVQRLAARSITLAMQEVYDGVTDERVAEYNVLLGHFERLAGEHDGAVPIEAIRDLLQGALEAKL